MKEGAPRTTERSALPLRGKFCSQEALVAAQDQPPIVPGAGGRVGTAGKPHGLNPAGVNLELGLGLGLGSLAVAAGNK